MFAEIYDIKCADSNCPDVIMDFYIWKWNFSDTIHYLYNYGPLEETKWNDLLYTTVDDYECAGFILTDDNGNILSKPSN